MAPDEKSSGFFFDVRAWRGSRSVQRMSMAERGVYLEMMCEQWEKRNLPDDAQQVADAIASSEPQVADVIAAWPVVRRKFLSSRGDESRIYNEQLERTRRQQAANRRKRQEAGARGGKVAAAKRKTTRELEASNAIADYSDAVANRSDKTRLDKTRTEENRSDLIRPDEIRPDPIRSRFDAFWVCYPKKVGKDDALRAWMKRKPSDALLGQMVAALEWQCQQDSWLRESGKFVPNPATWLNRGQWQDEPPAQGSMLSDTARYNLSASVEAVRLIEEAERGRKTEH